MSEEKMVEVVTKENSVRFRVVVGRQGDDIASIAVYVSLPGCSAIRWDKWAFSLCDETHVEQVVFSHPSGSTALVDVAQVARPSLAGLRLYAETILRLRRRAQPSRALLWACVIERLHGLGLVEGENGTPLEIDKLSAELLTACKEGGGLS